jgi:hypothetical protein
VEVLPSGKGNRAFWSDHGKAFVVTCSGDREKKKKLNIFIDAYLLECRIRGEIV